MKKTHFTSPHISLMVHKTNAAYSQAQTRRRLIAAGLVLIAVFLLTAVIIVLCLR